MIGEKQEIGNQVGLMILSDIVMEEYEYSFKVKSIKPYIRYCIDNNYKKLVF